MGRETCGVEQSDTDEPSRQGQETILGDEGRSALHVVDV